MQLLKGVLAFLMLSFSYDKEVNDTGGEVQRYMSLAVDDRNAVAISIAGPRHATTKNEERGPGRRRKKGKKLKIINNIKIHHKQQSHKLK